jgi:hypothetical protein
MLTTTFLPLFAVTHFDWLRSWMKLGSYPTRYGKWVAAGYFLYFEDQLLL